MRQENCVFPGQRHTAIRGLSGSLHFSTLPHKGQEFGGGGGEFTEHKMRVLIFYANLSETFGILRRLKRHIAIMSTGLHVKHASFL